MRYLFQAKRSDRMKTKQNPLPSLEDSLTEINKLIDTMEHSELTLEQSLANFERGITLIKHCQKVLNEAEQKVQILVQNNDKEELTAYGENTNDNNPEQNNE